MTMGIEKTCAVCKYANHDPSLGDREEIICTLNPIKPDLKPTNDTCLQHELKYKSLKIIEDKGTLLEYDSDTRSDKKISKDEYEELVDLEEIIKEDQTGESEVSWDL